MVGKDPVEHRAPGAMVRASRPQKEKRCWLTFRNVIRPRKAGKKDATILKSDGERGLFYKVLGCVVCAVGLAAGVVLFARSSSTIRPAPPIQEVARPRPGPSLRCLFSDFTHANVVVGFEFAVALPKDALPQFAERGEAVRDDPAIDFDADQRPRWIYAVDDDGTPTITSPDEATRILLYGFKPGIPDGSWIEAGIRSNTFRNLDGKCLQAHFNDVGRGDVARSAPQ